MKKSSYQLLLSLLVVIFTLSAGSVFAKQETIYSIWGEEESDVSPAKIYMRLVDEIVEETCPDFSDFDRDLVIQAFANPLYREEEKAVRWIKKFIDIIDRVTFGEYFIVQVTEDNVKPEQIKIKEKAYYFLLYNGVSHTGTIRIDLLTPVECYFGPSPYKRTPVTILYHYYEDFLGK